MLDIKELLKYTMQSRKRVLSNIIPSDILNCIITPYQGPSLNLIGQIVDTGKLNKIISMTSDGEDKLYFLTFGGSVITYNTRTDSSKKTNSTLPAYSIHYHKSEKSEHMKKKSHADQLIFAERSSIMIYDVNMNYLGDIMLMHKEFASGNYTFIHKMCYYFKSLCIIHEIGNAYKKYNPCCKKNLHIQRNKWNISERNLYMIIYTNREFPRYKIPLADNTQIYDVFIKHKILYICCSQNIYLYELPQIDELEYTRFRFSAFSRNSNHKYYEIGCIPENIESIRLLNTISCIPNLYYSIFEEYTICINDVITVHYNNLNTAMQLSKKIKRITKPLYTIDKNFKYKVISHNSSNNYFVVQYSNGSIYTTDIMSYE